MIEIEVTQADQDRVVLASEVFDRWVGAIASGMFVPSNQIEAIQVIQRQVRASSDDPTACIVLGIIEEANYELLSAMDTGDISRVDNALAHIMIDLCLVCTNLQLDFWTIASEFNPNAIIMPEGGDGFIALLKVVGLLAHITMKFEIEMDAIYEPKKLMNYKEQFGAVISRICSAVHWLAYSNDRDVVELCRSVFIGKEKYEDRGGTVIAKATENN